MDGRAKGDVRGNIVQEVIAQNGNHGRDTDPCTDEYDRLVTERVLSQVAVRTCQKRKARNCESHRAATEKVKLMTKTKLTRAMAKAQMTKLRLKSS